MTKAIVRAMLWKEWRETRWKWLCFILAFHIPLLLLVTRFPFDSSLRFRPMSGDARYSLLIALSLQTLFILTIGLFLIACYAASALAPEIESRRIFLLFEQPVKRQHTFLLKFIFGAGQMIGCIALSILLTISIAYLLTPLSAEGATLQGAWHDYLLTLGRGMRGIVAIGVVGLLVYAAAFLLSVVVKKWWIGVLAGTLSLLVVQYVAGGPLREWAMAAMRLREDPLYDTNFELFARIDMLPLILMLMFTALLYFISQFLFSRIEMK